jgi:hypothetical protein
MISSLIRRTQNFFRIPGATRRLFVEAILTSAYVRLALLFLPFKKVAGWLGSHYVTNDEQFVVNEDLIKNIRFAVRLCRKYVPWSIECYAGSLTAKIMLRRRNVSSTLYFGFLKDKTGNLKGHAWLRASNMIVTGHCDFSKYQVHSSFC